MTWQTLDTRPAPLPHLDSLPPVSRMLVVLGLELARWHSRSRSRRALARLDDHMLRDIGLSEQSRAHEADKPFWRD